MLTVRIIIVELGVFRLQMERLSPWIRASPGASSTAATKAYQPVRADAQDGEPSSRARASSRRRKRDRVGEQGDPFGPEVIIRNRRRRSEGREGCTNSSRGCDRNEAVARNADARPRRRAS